MSHFRISSIALVSLVAVLTACSDSPTSPAAVRSIPHVAGAGVNGKVITPPVTGTNPLPTVAPAPGILVRETFGFGPNNARPKGGKGDMTATFIHQTFGGFWAEWPGSKNAQWLAPDANQTWKFAGCSTNSNQSLPSPIDIDPMWGCIVSEWFDPVTSYPTALLPFTAPTTAAYEYSLDGYPARIPGGYIAMGFTSSGALTSNLTTSGLLWLRVEDRNEPDMTLHYELRTNGMNGPILASGNAGYPGYNPMALTYDPINHTASLSVYGLAIGTWPVTIAAPKYIAFEGVGVLDNLIVRQK